MALMDDVYCYIEENYQPNEPIFMSDLNIQGIKPVSVRQQIKKLTESGKLKRFDTGIYYIPLVLHYLTILELHKLFNFCLEFKKGLTQEKLHIQNFRGDIYNLNNFKSAHHKSS